jgi:hypothetical protein
MRCDAYGEGDDAASTGCSGGFAGDAHGLFFSRDHDLINCVHIRYDDNTGGLRADHRDPIGGHPHNCGHAAGAIFAGSGHRTSANRDYAERVLERKRARNNKCGELADAMAGDEVGEQTRRFERARGGDGGSQDGRLRHGGGSEEFCGAVEANGSKIPTEDLSSCCPRLDGRLGFACTHADRLAPLTRENPGNQSVPPH